MPPDIASLVPQSGPMCLLQEVTHSDAHGIVCRAMSHRAVDNPLRCDGALPAMAGIEYAAQALAAHCALLARDAPGEPVRGLLAGVREVKLHVERLDNVEGPLTVRASRLVANGPRLLYAFAVHSGERELLSGRVAVVLQPGATT